MKPGPRAVPGVLPPGRDGCFTWNGWMGAKGRHRPLSRSPRARRCSITIAAATALAPARWSGSNPTSPMLVLAARDSRWRATCRGPVRSARHGEPEVLLRPWAVVSGSAAVSREASAKVPVCEVLGAPEGVGSGPSRGPTSPGRVTSARDSSGDGQVEPRGRGVRAWRVAHWISRRSRRPARVVPGRWCGAVECRRLGQCGGMGRRS